MEECGGAMTPYAYFGVAFVLALAVGHAMGTMGERGRRQRILLRLGGHMRRGGITAEQWALCVREAVRGE